MKKKIPTFYTDEEAEAFVADEDLSQYDLSGGEVVQFEFQPSCKSITIPLSEELFAAIQQKAALSGMPYQHFIQQTLERSVY